MEAQAWEAGILEEYKKSGNSLLEKIMGSYTYTTWEHFFVNPSKPLKAL